MKTATLEPPSSAPASPTAPVAPAFVPACSATDLQLVDHLTRVGARRMAERRLTRKESPVESEA